MRRSKRSKKALSYAVLTALACLPLAVVGASHAAPSGIGNNWYAAAPYLMPQSNSPPDPVAVMTATGLKAFQLAFILAPNGGGCTPTWDGTSAVSSDTAVAGVISRIRAAGGDVSVSIGGYGGTKLGQTCGTPAATAAAYQQVITKYGLKAVDFDLEEPEYENDAAINNELGAAKILQTNNPGLFISVTMPGTAAGTGWFGTLLLDKSKSLGFYPNNFSIMPFDGGFNGASSQISALEAFHNLLMSHMGWDSATAYAHEGFSGMNGKSDVSEFFYQADFESVLNYAGSHRLGRFTFWSINRDRPCGASTDNGICSNVTQNAWDFAKYSVRFAGSNPPTDPIDAGPPPACSAPAWSPTAVYTGGSVVLYNGHKWTAKWWTQNDPPGGSVGVWTDNGPCTP